MKYIFLLCLAILIFTACKPREDENPLFGPVYECLPGQPEVALQRLDRMSGGLTPQENAISDLLTYYANDLLNFGYHNDSLVMNILRNSHRYKNNKALSLWYYYKGEHLMALRQYDDAIETFHLSEELARRRGDDFLLGLIYMRSSEAFYERSLFITAIAYAEKSREHFQLAGDFRYANRAQAFRLFSALELREANGCDELYRNIREGAFKYKDLEFFRFLANELLYIHLSYDALESALEVDRDLKNLFPARAPLPMQYVFMADVDIDQGEYESAKEYLAQAEQLTVEPYERATVHQVYVKYYKSVGDYLSALTSMERHIAVYDSLFNVKQRLSIVHLEGRAQNFKLESELKNSVIARQRMFFYGSLTMLLLLTIIFFYRNKSRKQYHELVNRMAIVCELKESNENLLVKLDTHQEKENRLKQEIDSKLIHAKLLAELYFKFPDKPAAIIKRMNEMTALAPANKEFITSLINTVNVYYNNAIEKLMSEHPDLSPSEILFSALVIAGFSINEMALILNSNSVDAVYTRKYRLKQKLHLGKDIDLENYLAAFSAETE